MLNLFALTDDPANRKLRFSLSQDVQQDLTTLLKSQEAEFSANIQDEIAFDGKYKPDFGEVLTINDFDDIDDLASAIDAPLNIPEVNPSPELFGSIKALFSGYRMDDGNIKVIIQYFDRRRVISTNGLSIFHSNNVYKKIEGIGLTIDSKLAGVLVGSKLSFHSFHFIKQIFDLSTYYKEATDVDIQQFSTLESISVSNAERLAENSDAWVRRKLWLISQSGILENVPMKEIRAVAAEFGIPLDILNDNGTEKIIIPEGKKELKELLRFLDEDYYKSPLLQNTYITNSKRPA
ncbi:Kiwa anti-phage protein KwaB-like domain-containing protein [Chitinilyticum litopenaei]|uniref:Kiwa anti-phage protein KwaB-like domain-containing protein n=1 Tax=Chitinilyticum litopenaei TaxID=1121276 RepID=UPI000412968A|nr:Kiwa anti-phage protein KwaB-like domain-containing protein [Chitinilyticum litopenaei]